MISGMISGIDYAAQAQSSAYTGIKYSQLDCQAFVERVLKDCGVRKANGSPYDWKGSNDMWRNALAWKGTIEECRARYGEIPMGAWVFIVKHDGGEIARGYHDSKGNASHVGIYCRNDNECVRDSTRTSTRDGVGYRTLRDFTHVGLPKMIGYGTQTGSGTAIMDAVAVIRNAKANDSDWFAALTILIDYYR